MRQSPRKLHRPPQGAIVTNTKICARLKPASSNMKTFCYHATQLSSLSVSSVINNTSSSTPTETPSLSVHTNNCSPPPSSLPSPKTDNKRQLESKPSIYQFCKAPALRRISDFVIFEEAFRAGFHVGLD